MQQQAKDLSIILVAHNVKDLVRKCLTCVENSKDNLQKEVIYVDNGSDDGTVEMIHEEFSGMEDLVLIKSPENLGFIKANNIGYQSANGKYILMLNSDAFVGENTLQNLTDFMEETPECGVVGCQAVDADGNLLPSARSFPTPWRIFLTKMGWAEKLPFKDINDMEQSPDEVRECDWVTGCCLLVRKEIVDRQDFFLRPELFMYNDDNDLCLRVKQGGWKVFFHPERITHLAGVNNEKIMEKEKDLLRLKRLTLESDYIYFRHNRNLLWVLWHFLLILLYETIQIVKNAFLLRSIDKIRQSAANISLAAKLLIKTRFGESAVENA